MAGREGVIIEGAHPPVLRPLRCIVAAILVAEIIESLLNSNSSRSPAPGRLATGQQASQRTPDSSIEIAALSPRDSFSECNHDAAGHEALAPNKI
jgi:hypothetical protein